MNTYKRVGLILAVVMVFALDSFVLAADNELLRGLQAVYVTVTDFDAKIAQEGGLYEHELRTDAELKLRLAGIKVVTESDAHKLDYPVQLHLYTAIAKAQVALVSVYYYWVGVKLLEFVKPLRKPGHIARAPIWESGFSFGYNEANLSKVRQSAQDHMDQFINAWLSVNPKK